MKKLLILMGISFLAVSPFSVSAQLLDPVSYSVVEVPDTVKAAEVFEVTVRASIDENWHLYSVLNNPELGPFPTEFSTPSSEMEIAGQVRESKAEIEYDPNFETELGWHSDHADFRIPVAFNRNATGNQTVLLEVYYQVCDDRSCLPPRTKEIRSEIFLAGFSQSPYIGRSEKLISLQWIGIIALIAVSFLGIFYFYKSSRKN